MAALREVEAELELTRNGTLPWRSEYQEIFGDVTGLLNALKNRWALMLAAQVDSVYDASGKPSAATRALAAQHQGLLKVIAEPKVRTQSGVVTLLSTRQDRGMTSVRDSHHEGAA
jgi:hypothetical protein